MPLTIRMASATAVPGVVVDQDDTDLARTTIRRVSLRLLPFLFLLFVCNYIDRTNVSIAALQMNRDLRFSASTYGLGTGIFFVGYLLFEVPSNLILARVGARRWIARFMIAVPLAGAIGNPISAWLLGLDGWYGLAGWQWVFLLEGLPSVLIGFTVLAILTDRPSHARWLSETQREWLVARLQRDGDESSAPHGVPPLSALAHPIVLLSSLLYFLAMTSHYGYLFWAPTIVRDELHASSAAVGVITGGIACCAAGVMLVVGSSSDRTGERFFHAAACLALAALGYVGAALLGDPVTRVASLALVPAGIYGFLAPFWCLPSAILRGAAAAAGIAFVNSFGNLGGVVGLYALGVLKDATGSTTGALLGLAMMALAAGVLCVVLRRQAAFAFRDRASS